jgi:hypothetical protein
MAMVGRTESDPACRYGLSGLVILQDTARQFIRPSRRTSFAVIVRKRAGNGRPGPLQVFEKRA